MTTVDEAPKERGSVLLVDDDHDVLASMARFLRLEGFGVCMAQNMRDAVKRLNSNESVDAVVTDLNMEGGSGIELCAFVRCEFPSIPVILFSGMANTKDVVEAMQLGAETFMEKPVAPDELVSQLDKMISDTAEAAPLRVTPDAGPNANSLNQRVREFEKFLIEQALSSYKGSVKEAMESLGLNRRTMNEKMSRLGVKRG